MTVLENLLETSQIPLTYGTCLRGQLAAATQPIRFPFHKSLQNVILRIYQQHCVGEC
jgi:hypothetical protein